MHGQNLSSCKSEGDEAESSPSAHLRNIRKQTGKDYRMIITGSKTYRLEETGEDDDNKR